MSERFMRGMGCGLAATAAALLLSNCGYGYEEVGGLQYDEVIHPCNSDRPGTNVEPTYRPHAADYNIETDPDQLLAVQVKTAKKDDVVGIGTLVCDASSGYTSEHQVLTQLAVQLANHMSHEPQ